MVFLRPLRAAARNPVLPACAALGPRIPPSTTALTSLFASLSLRTHSRPASILSRLSNNPAAYSKRKRIGRGPSSGYGKTSGRGHKGQKQHSRVKPWFQGGQTPLILIKGRKGFDNFRAPVLSTINLDQLQEWIDKGRLDPLKQITPKEIIECGLVGSVKDGIKLLARGKETFRTPVNIVVSRASSEAIASIEKAGGRILTRFYTKQSIRNLLTGKSIHSEAPLPIGAEFVEAEVAKVRKNPLLKRLPDPTSRWDIEYYRDPAHRGYLSHQLKPGESPSLFFGVPKEKRIAKAPRQTTQAQKEDTLF